jgi:hypothetical protein
MSISMIVISGIALACIVTSRPAIAKRSTTKVAITELFRVDLDVAFILLSLQLHPLLKAKRAC